MSMPLTWLILLRLLLLLHKKSSTNFTMALPPRGEAIWENPEFFLRIFPYG